MAQAVCSQGSAQSLSPLRTPRAPAVALNVRSTDRHRASLTWSQEVFPGGIPGGIPAKGPGGSDTGPEECVRGMGQAPAHPDWTKNAQGI